MNRDIPFPDRLRDEADALELQATWRLLQDATPAALPAEATDQALGTIRRRLAAEGPKEGIRPGSGGPGSGAFRRILLRAAAVAALALGGTGAWYAVPVTHGAGPGERIAVTLPDGSAVELNAGSELSHRRGFSLLPGIYAGSRGVRLRGEAFFRVQPGVRPFVVDAGDASVRVLGTRFNVRARAGDGAAPGSVRVEVEEGRVEVWGGGDRALLLSAGEAARVDSDSGALHRDVVEPGRIASWRSGGLTMVDESLSAILAELGLRFGVGIELSDPAAGAARLNVYYPGLETLESLESVLADLATQQDLRYRRTNDGWELF